MKHNPRVLICLFAVFIVVVPRAFADTTPIVQPNEYKQGEIEIQTDHFHEESLLNQKNNLSEAQQQLTFKQEPYSFFETIQNGLFSGEQDTNTITAKTDKLQLFSTVEKEGAAPLLEQEKEKPSGQPYWLIAILSLLVIILIGYLFFVLVPKINKL